MDKYLLPTNFLDSRNPDIINLVQGLVEPDDSQAEKARKIFLFVRDSINYDMYAVSNVGDDYVASSILGQGRGFCVQKAIILAALGRAADIPSRLVLVAIRNHKSPPDAMEIMGTNVFFPHMYNQFFINGKWVNAAATFDRKICERINVPWVEFDGLNDAILPARDNDGNIYIEYVDEYGEFADFPFQIVLQNATKYYDDYTLWFDKIEK
ncbi:MAG TPA: transglutaminase-like domain-containing protein [Syntrophomonadaceae bacterium]|nr:transglutaminase-like domain-containing protein [Syntrophomonadaceae bacterium]